MTVQMLVGNGLLILSTLEAWAFIILYHVLAQWWRTEVGRNVMALAAVIAVVLSLSMVRIVAGASIDVTWYIWLRIIVFAGLPIVLGWRIWLLVRAQLRERRQARTSRKRDE